MEQIFAYVIGLGASVMMPVMKELELDSFLELKAEHFLDRRELGVINVGGPGEVKVKVKEEKVGGGEQWREESYPLEFKEALYVGCGQKVVTFKSLDPKKPAKFYLNSAPAYKEYVR